MKRLLAALLTIALLLSLCPASLAAEKTAIAFDKSVTKLFEGETLQTTLVRTGDAREGTVTYSTKSKNISVDQNGVILGVAKGQGTVTATLKVGKRTLTATLTLTILRHAESAELQTDSLRLTAADDRAVSYLLEAADDQVVSLIDADPHAKVLLFSIGTAYSLRSTVLPAGASDRTPVYSISDDTVFSLKGSNLKPLRAGTAVLTVASKQDPDVRTDYIALSIQPAKRVTVNGPASGYIGDELQLTAVFTPNETSIRTVSWQSANPKVATVDAEGVVTGVSKGSARITATTTDGSKRIGDITIRIKQQPEGIRLNRTSVGIHVGKTSQLTAKLLPANADQQTILFESSDPTIATVNSKGVISAHQPGTCTITAYCADFPDVLEECVVTSIQPVTRISLRSAASSIKVNESTQVYWDVQPANATDPSVTLSSAQPKIATVDSEGNVYGLSRGVATIYAKANDGSGVRGSVKVEVIQPVYGVHMKEDSIRVGVGETIHARAILEPSNANNTHMTWTVADRRYASVSGSNTKPEVTGKRWGTTTITGVTEDGGYTTTCTVHVGNLNKALRIMDLYLQDNKIRINVTNESNMTITRFTYHIECFNMVDQPMAVTDMKENSFDGYYRHTLEEGETTTHGRYTFVDFVQPKKSIGRVVMTLTGYTTEDGYKHTIKPENRIYVEYRAAGWHTPTPSPTPTPTPTPTPEPEETPSGD